MKAKHNIPEVSTNLQVAANAAPPKEPLYEGLSQIKRLVPFLEMSDVHPSADECENLNYTTFVTAKNLLELIAWGEESLVRDCGSPVEEYLIPAAAALDLQLEIMRLTSKTLFALHGGDTFAHKPR